MTNRITNTFVTLCRCVLWAFLVAANFAQGEANVAASGEERSNVSRQKLGEQLAHFRVLVRTANEQQGGAALEELLASDRALSIADERLHRLLLESMMNLDERLLAHFEENWLEVANKTLPIAAGLERSRLERSRLERSRLELIAALNRQLMSRRLGRWFIDHFEQVQAYKFKEPLIRGGWIRPGVDERKGLQGQMVAGSTVCEDPALTAKWLKLAEASEGDQRLLILWALGYSSQKESFHYLLWLTPRDAREKIVIENALVHSVWWMETLSNRLADNEVSFGMLSAAEAQELQKKLKKLIPECQLELKQIGLERAYPHSMYGLGE